MFAVSVEFLPTVTLNISFVFVGVVIPVALIKKF
jgi:hypothetical protein